VCVKECEKERTLTEVPRLGPSKSCQSKGAGDDSERCSGAGEGAAGDAIGKLWSQSLIIAISESILIFSDFLLSRFVFMQ